MVYLTIALLALAVLLAALYFLQRSQAKRLTKQLEKLNDEQRTQIVTMSFPSRVNQGLVREINRFLLDKQKTEQEWRVEELRLQEMVSNISHDMRTPLTAVLGYIRLINTSELDETERRRYLTIIEARARSLQRLLLDFYDLSRILFLSKATLDFYYLHAKKQQNFFGVFLQFQIGVDSGRVEGNGEGRFR